MYIRSKCKPESNQFSMQCCVVMCRELCSVVCGLLRLQGMNIQVKIQRQTPQKSTVVNHKMYNILWGPAVQGYYNHGPILRVVWCSVSDAAVMVTVSFVEQCSSCRCFIYWIFGPKFAIVFVQCTSPCIVHLDSIMVSSCNVDCSVLCAVQVTLKRNSCLNQNFLYFLCTHVGRN